MKAGENGGRVEREVLVSVLRDLREAGEELEELWARGQVLAFGEVVEARLKELEEGANKSNKKGRKPLRACAVRSWNRFPAPRTRFREPVSRRSTARTRTEATRVVGTKGI